MEDPLKVARRIERRLRAKGGLGPTLNEFADHVTLGGVDPLKPVFSRHIAVLYITVTQAITNRKTAATALRLIDEGVVLDLFATGEHHFRSMHHIGILLNRYINIIRAIITEDPEILLNEERAERAGAFAVAATKAATLAIPHLRDEDHVVRAAATAAVSGSKPTIPGALTALSGVSINPALDDELTEEAIMRLRNFFLHALRALPWQGATKLIAEALNTLSNDAVNALVRHDVEDYVIMWNAWLFNRLQRLHHGEKYVNALLSALRAYADTALPTDEQESGIKPYIEKALRTLTPDLLNEGIHALQVFNTIVNSTTSIIKPSTQQYVDDETQARALAMRITALASDAIAKAINELNDHEKVTKPFSNALGNAALAILDIASKEGMLTRDSGDLVRAVTDLTEPIVRALALLLLKFGVGILQDAQKLVNRIINSMYSQGWNELFLVTMLNDPDTAEEFINGSTEWQEDLGTTIR